MKKTSPFKVWHIIKDKQYIEKGDKYVEFYLCGESQIFPLDALTLERTNLMHRRICKRCKGKQWRLRKT